MREENQRESAAAQLAGRLLVARRRPVAEMKVFLIYEEEGQPYHKLAITLPNKWLEQSADKVKECFVERYNKKFPDTPLDDVVAGRATNRDAANASG